ncbi:IS110 family transposase [Paractinoplanes maris]|uniref:IS110 family transposase n=1 Tax=Paractinoplanes maris TaxID=1734446 RepID=UPI00202154A1|nr:IS110 family transposase [Actinoplanes maris]
MAAKKRQVVGGVDTHGKFHHAAVIDDTGRQLADQQFPATQAGYQLLLLWLRRAGRLVKVGVEGTGSYGAGLARYLSDAGVQVVEVDRPDRKARRRQGKSDPLDAYAAARAVLSGRATGVPKTRTGPVESIRLLRAGRRAAVKARTAAINQLRASLTCGPQQLREQMQGLTQADLVQRCAALAFDENRLADPLEAARAALADLAEQIRSLNVRIARADRRLGKLVTAIAPALSAVHGVGTDVAGQLLTTAGDNPERLRSEAALAHLCGVAPIPASSGRIDRHRLNRGGDRAANSALFIIALVRMRSHAATRAYVEKRTRDGLNKKEIIRCLKRYIVREIYTALMTDLTSPNTA